IFDSSLSFNAQVTKVIQTCFLQLRQISKIKSLLSFSDLEKIFYAFISSRLDNCNALYSGISKGNIHQLQLIENTAARLLTRSRRSDRISLILAGLHCFPVSFRIDFKVLLIVFKALHGSTPSHMRDRLTCCKPDCCLRSSGKILLVVPRCHVAKGGQAFSRRLRNSCQRIIVFF
ncbi:hypothetical protein LDENG_00087880, partial [Lucifuga dentata]